MRNILLFCLLLCACKRSPNYVTKDFKQVTPKQYWLNLDSVKAPIKCFEIINNEIIAIDDANNLLTYDISTKQTHKIVSEKSSPVDFISPKEIFALSPEKFVVYDLTSDSFFEYLHNAGKWAIGKSFQLDFPLHGLPSISPVSSNQFVATSLNNVEGKLIIGKLSPKPEIEKYIGKIEKKESENKYITGMINRSSCVFDKWTNNIFVGNFYSDKLECYNLNQELVFETNGPDGFDPIYKVKKVQSDQVFVNTPETRDAFISITADKKYIYALYSGKTTAQLAKNADKTIYIFSKTGIPVKKILVKSDIGLIKADDATQSLYCYFIDNNPKTQILVFDTKGI
ncbi:BF3164 family lipoprotein [Pedobacter sp. MR22-3]|uniref:BF3164 family lipoprotein n=1 Tax=Pedobacter sp. MR22-3 TaxID=2994552 RepID=UPI0022462C2F|nr:BF3164 family lipoprotein [Pedobacter sp. MR22-3]MCX2584739.1 BF3164 family lipoprotein [Pedobacter sp. MR22-3]